MNEEFIEENQKIIEDNSFESFYDKKIDKNQINLQKKENNFSINIY